MFMSVQCEFRAIYFCRMDSKLSLAASMLMVIATITPSIAQDAFSSIGGDAAGTGGSEAFSVGLVVYTELGGTGGSLSQGIQHAYEVFPVAVHDPYTEDSFSAYPNPVADELIILAITADFEGRFIQLFDASGRLLHQVNLTSDRTPVNTAPLSSGTYIVRMLRYDSPTHSFTIIKH
jgi:hypothetical protein